MNAKDLTNVSEISYALYSPLFDQHLMAEKQKQMLQDSWNYGALIFRTKNKLNVAEKPIYILFHFLSLILINTSNFARIKLH